MEETIGQISSDFQSIRGLFEFLHQVPVNFSVILGDFLGLYQYYTLRTKWLEQLACTLELWVKVPNHIFLPSFTFNSLPTQ